MKKIGILTFHRAINYGGVLQNFSLQKKLIDLGYEVETIDFYSKPVYDIYNTFYIGKFNLIKTPLRFVVNLFNYRNNKRIKIKFNDFIKNNIRISKQYDKNNIKNIQKKYEYIISGSDQVWNKDITKDDYNVFDLSLFDSNKKIAYAASIGKDNISSTEMNYYCELIKNYKKVSVREKSFALKLGTSVSAVLDPVFFHTKDEWIKSLSLNSNKNEEYIFVFSLERTKQISKIIKEISKKYKVTCICSCLYIRIVFESILRFFISNLSDGNACNGIRILSNITRNHI